MKIDKIVVNNFRKLKRDVSIPFDDIMLLVGKNNSGKTSVYELIDKFLGSGSFLSQDFNEELLRKDFIDNLLVRFKELPNDETYLEELSNLKNYFQK